MEFANIAGKLSKYLMFGVKHDAAFHSLIKSWKVASKAMIWVIRE